MTSRTLVIVVAAAVSAFVVTLTAPPSVKPALAWTANGGRGCATYDANGTRNCIQNPRSTFNQGKKPTKKPPQH